MTPGAPNLSYNRINLGPVRSQNPYNYSVSRIAEDSPTGCKSVSTTGIDGAAVWNRMHTSKFKADYGARDPFMHSYLVF